MASGTRDALLATLTRLAARPLSTSLLWGAVVCVTGCTDLGRSQKMERDMTARCQTLEESARVDTNSANAALASVHLTAAQMDNIAEIDAAYAPAYAALQAASEKRRQADDCWSCLAAVRDTHRFMGSGAVRMEQPTPTSTPDPSVYNLGTRPPAAPSPSPLPNLGQQYTPSQATPTPQFVPDEGMSGAMPGIGPSGTAK